VAGLPAAAAVAAAGAGGNFFVIPGRAEGANPESS
jgi:hypothetical protein